MHEPLTFIHTGWCYEELVKTSGFIANTPLQLSRKAYLTPDAHFK